MARLDGPCWSSQSALRSAHLCIDRVVGSVCTWAGEGAEAFLGTQGDIWDTQSDIAIALIGAIIALLTLSGFHEKQLAKLCQTDKKSSNTESSR